MISASAPVIETERLILRGPTDADVDMWAAHLADPDVLRYLPRRSSTPRVRAEQVLNAISQSWQHSGGDIGWVIVPKEGGEVMGWSGAGPHPDRPYEAEIVYMLGRRYWGRGFATEAARAVVRYGFENTEWLRIIAAIIPGNVASRRVLEHLGFVYEKDVDYVEMTGDTTLEMDSPIVPFFALTRYQYATGAFPYRVIPPEPRP